MAASVGTPGLAEETPTLEEAAAEEDKALGTPTPGTEKGGDEPADGEGDGSEGGAGGGGGAEVSTNPAEGEAEVEGGGGAAVEGAEEGGGEAEVAGEEAKAEEKDGEGAKEEKLAEGGASEGGGGGHAVTEAAPVAPTRTPQVGIGPLATLGGSVSEGAAKAIQEQTGLSADQHRASAQAAVDALHGEISSKQIEHVALAEQLAAETRSGLESQYTGLIQGDIATVMAATSGAFGGAASRVQATAETVKGQIDGAASTAVADLATTVSEANGLLSTAVTTARARLEELRGAWSGTFTEVETRRAAEFGTAAGAAADQLVANKETIASTFAGEGSALERAKGELRSKAARKIVDQDAEEMRAAGPTRAQQAITELGHAGIVDGWIQPLESRVDTAATEGEAAITAAHDTAVEQIEADRISAREKVDTDAAAAVEQIGADSATAQEDAEVAGEQLEADLGTDLGDLDARFTDASADVADSYAAFAESLGAALDTTHFLDAPSVAAFVAMQNGYLAELTAQNEERLHGVRDEVDGSLREHLDQGRETFLALQQQNESEASRLGDEKVAALEGIGTAFADSLTATAESVSAAVTRYTDPLGADFEAYVTEVETELEAKQAESDARLGEKLTAYQTELSTEIQQYADNIDPGPVTAGLEEKLRSICQDCWSAMRGMGTDEDKVFNALRKLETPAMGEAVKELWPRVHSGATGVRAQLVTFLRDDLDDGEYNIACAYLRGDRAEGARLELEDNMNWYGDDEAQIEAILRSLDPEERTAMQDLPGWEQTGAALRDNLGGTDLNVTEALLVNNEARADAYRLRDAIDKARREGDDDALHTALAGMDPGRREQIAQEFHHVRNGIEANAVDVPPIEQDDAFAELITYSTREVETMHYTEGAQYDPQTGRYRDSVDGASANLVAALVTEGNDSLAADVSRFEVERTRRGGPKEENMETALMMSAQDQAALRDPNHPDHAEAVARQAQRATEFEAEWQRQYGGQEGGPASAHEAIGEMYADADNSELEVEAHRMMLEDGTNSARVVAAVTELSIDGSGTDEDRMKRIWSGVTPQEADEAQALWAAEHGEDGETLEERLHGGTFSEYSGDEAREIRIAMLGDSQYFTGEYADRHLQVAQIEYDYSVGEEGGLFSGAAGDESESLRINHERLQAVLDEVADEHGGNAFDSEGRFQGTDEQYARYTELCAFIGINAANHRERIDSITNMITTAIAITGAILAIVLTAGAAAPAVAAITAGVTAGAGVASMGANYVMRGGRYGWEQAAVDLGVTAVTAATAGAGTYLNEAGHAARIFGSKASGQVGVAMGTGFVDNTATTAMQDATWKNGFGSGLGESFYSGFRGSLTSGVSTRVGQGMETSRLGQYLDDADNIWASGANKAISGGTSAMAGETTTISADALFRDRRIELDEAGERIGTKGALGAGQGFLEGGTGKYMEQRQAAQQHLDEQAEQYHAHEEETAAQLEQTDQENAQEVQAIEDRAMDGVHENEQGEPATTVGREEVQGELDAVADDLLAADREVVDQMQDDMEGVQRALDEVEAIDQQIAAETEAEQSRTAAPEADDSRAYEEELLLMALIEQEQAGNQDAVDHILSDPDQAVERGADILPALRGDEGADQGFVTHGIEADDAAMESPVFQAMVEESIASGNSPEKALRYSRSGLESGTDLPTMYAATGETRLYKLVPQGEGVSGHSPFFMSESEYQLALANPDGLGDYFGLPEASVSPVYDVYEIGLKEGASANLFEQEIAPITENQQYRPGGGRQVLVQNRKAFTDPVKVGQIEDVGYGGSR